MNITPFYETENSTQTIYHGGALEVMDYLISIGIKFDAIISDPPYGTTNCRWDSVIDVDKMWDRLKLLRKDNAPIILFAQIPFNCILGASNIKELRYEWIWEKTQATGHLNAKKMPLKAHENIMVFYKKLPQYFPQKTYGHKPVNSYTKYVKTQNNTEIYGHMNKELSGGGNTDRYPRSVLKYKSDKQTSKLHSTQKPIALADYLIDTYTKEGDLILDFAIGSGTFIVSSQNNGRRSIGVEIEKKYCKISKQRLINNQGKQLKFKI